MCATRSESDLGDEPMSEMTFNGPPNEECHVAVLSGLSLSNLVGFQPGDLTPYFRFGDETVCVWTHAEHEYSKLVSDVRGSAHLTGQPWKTLSSCLEIAASLSSVCEHIYEFSYWWISDFNERTSLEEQDFYGYPRSENIWLTTQVKQGAIHDLCFLADLAPLLDLLQRDDRFFIAAQHFLASIRNHWCCLICELGADPLMHHPSHEPESWEAIQLYPHLDIGMVQACRVAETLLGKPSASRERPKQHRAIERWRSVVTIEPTDTFERVGENYFAYYQAMYAERNQAAHGRGELPFDSTRRKVIDAQCFAWLVLDNYAGRHVRDPEEARDCLEFSRELLAQEVRGTAVKMTYPPEEAARQREGLRRIYRGEADAANR
jgi:hypothetical protein